MHYLGYLPCMGGECFDVGALSELAASDARSEQFRGGSLAVLERAIGFDFAIMWRFDGPTANDATIHGFAKSFWERYCEELPRFRAELAPLMGAATTRGAVSDREVFSLRDRSRLGFYADIVRPIGSRTYLTGVMVLRGRPMGAIQLGRTGSEFDARSVSVLRDALPILALGDAIRDGDRPRADPILTPREREIVEYAALGFTAKEIATACGNAPNTVRNQLARLYRKLGVANRAELVAVLART
jgi:DNA-binding CsgD family transcriptional regulator